MNFARTPGTPAWLQDALASGTIQIRLEANPRSPQYASMIMLASDFWDTDFCIGQDNSDLLVWLRRPGSNADGDPAFVIEGALQPQRWHSVNLTVRHGDLRVDVDGRTRLTEHLPANFLGGWSPGQIALGDEVHGGLPWQGGIRLAEVRVPSYAVDYVRLGALSTPERYFYSPDRIEPFPPVDGFSYLDLLFHLLLFLPVGFLIVWARRPPVRPIPASLLAAALAVVLAAGKFLFAGREVAAADIVMQVVGALLGALLAWPMSRLSRSA